MINFLILYGAYIKKHLEFRENILILVMKYDDNNINTELKYLDLIS